MTMADDDETFDIDLNSLKVREIEEIEELTGIAIDALLANGHPKGKAVRAIGFIVKKRTNPDFTWEDAGELVIRLSDGAPDPPDAAD